MRLGAIFFGVTFRLSGAVNPVQSAEAAVAFGHDFGEGFCEQFIPGLSEQAAEGGIDIAHDVAVSLDDGYWAGRMIEGREAEAQRPGRLAGCACWWVHCHDSAMPYDLRCRLRVRSFLPRSFSSGGASSSCSLRGP